mmetsp:Transcript_13251/g.41843  ORF Transcript_13251/g.41843 Transcript_13251/m.41843 type:complete len:254 (+) Transcript_13251:1463-2224(+)
MGRRLVGRARRRRLEGLLEEAAAAKGLGHNARAHTLLQEVAGHAGAGPFARVAAYELALILSQLGRHEEADAWLGRISFSYKLSPCILDASSLSGPTSRGATDVVAAFDGVLPPDLLRGLQAAFAPDSPFWPEHGYPRPRSSRTTSLWAAPRGRAPDPGRCRVPAAASGSRLPGPPRERTGPAPEGGQRGVVGAPAAARQQQRPPAPLRPGRGRPGGAARGGSAAPPAGLLRVVPQRWRGRGGLGRVLRHLGD